LSSENLLNPAIPLPGGHLLIVPKRYAPDWFLMSERERREADDLIRILRLRLSDSLHVLK